MRAGLSVCACGQKSSDIYILSNTDVHCASDNIYNLLKRQGSATLVDIRSSSKTILIVQTNFKRQGFDFKKQISTVLLV